VRHQRTLNKKAKLWRSVLDVSTAIVHWHALVTLQQSKTFETAWLFQLASLPLTLTSAP
jgi:hypothetical protein